MSKIYLDFAAATPLAPEVLTAMQPYFSDKFYNPSAVHAAARETRKDLEDARAKIAYWLGTKPSEIIYTAGGTEANNLAIHGVMQKQPRGNVVVSSIEHESILGPAGKYETRLVKVGRDGRLDLDDLRKKIDSDTALVSIGYANNEIGTVQPIRPISQIIA